MRKYLLTIGFFILCYSQIVSANCVSYSGWVDLDPYKVTQSQCMNEVIKAGKKANFPSMKKIGTAGTHASGENKEKSVIHVTCLTYKNIVIVTINASTLAERKRIYNIFDKELKKGLKQY